MEKWAALMDMRSYYKQGSNSLKNKTKQEKKKTKQKKLYEPVCHQAYGSNHVMQYKIPKMRNFI